MPRAGLSPNVLVDEAALLVDEHGLEALSLSALADRVGVRPPSLYKHVAGADDLRRRLSARGYREAGERMSAAIGDRRGTGALRALAGAWRAFALERPGLYAATTRAPAPDDADLQAAAAAPTAILLDVVRGYGLRDEAAAVHVARAVRSALHGFVTLEAAGGFGLPESVDASFEHLVDLLDAAIRPTG